LVLDTGSTDGTQALVRVAFGATPGDVPEEIFVDFGASRSRALELLGTQAVFSLMLSGDETLVDGAALRRFCEEHAGAPGAAPARRPGGPPRPLPARSPRAGGWLRPRPPRPARRCPPAGPPAAPRASGGAGGPASGAPAPRIRRSGSQRRRWLAASRRDRSWK